MENASGFRTSPSSTNAAPRESLAGPPDLVPTGSVASSSPPGRAGTGAGDRSDPSRGSRSKNEGFDAGAADSGASHQETLAAGFDDDTAPPVIDEVDWQTAMRRAVRSPAELRRRLGLSADEPVLEPGGLANSFATFVPLEFLARMNRGDADDPLLRQVLPTESEETDDDRFAADPVGDIDALAADGLLHKYPGRALVISTGVCGIHCRYCFRREFPYREAGSRREAWQPSLDYLRRNPTIDEVLLSGGDPLTLVDDGLAGLIDQIARIDHVRRLRIHSRMPIVIPQRITAALLDQLSETRLAVWMVVHANHPRELDPTVLERLGQLIDRGIPVLNQAVLLRGVNDRAETLIELCRKLVDHRIQPYYLHQLDRVRGTTHFEVTVADGLRLVEQLRAALPGYAVPTYVAEQAGQSSKTPLAHVHF